MRTSVKVKTSNKAFTLIELSVAVVVIVLIAGIVVPRVGTVREAVRAKLSLDAVQRLASRARETAISTGRPVTMAFNETDSQFELRQNDENGEGTVVATANLHPDIITQSFVAGSTDMTSSDWEVTFYSDGTSDGGSIEVDQGGIQRTLVLGSKSGLSKWQDGQAPANDEDKWQAGEYERRG